MEISGDATPTFKRVELTNNSRVNLFKTEPNYPYENLDYCIKTLQNGLKARKFHYSKKG